MNHKLHQVEITKPWLLHKMYDKIPDGKTWHEWVEENYPDED